MQIRKLLTISILVFCLTSCVDEFWPDTDKYDSLLVVDGLLTNSSDEVVVRLSYSSPLYDEILKPLNDAEVFFTDENGIIAFLFEEAPGIYKAIDSSFCGQVGISYQLHINPPGGKQYVSDICQIPPPLSIETVYGEDEYPDESNNDYDFPGIQFYVENASNLNDTLYYYWKLYQTYEYRSTFDIDYTWEGELIPNPNATDLRTCWRSSRINNFLFASTEQLVSTSGLNTFPLHFVSTNTKELSIRYSVLVRQLSILKLAFEFYDAIDQQNEEQGSMWSRQPLQIQGNMQNINNPEEHVLGYFIVAGLSEKRIFVNRPNLPFHYYECAPDFEAMQFIQFEPSEMWPIYIDDIMFLGLARAESDECFDCRLSGGSLTPPDFWE